jgi:hypothetical protein
MKHHDAKPHNRPIVDDADPMDVLFENFNPARQMGLEQSKTPEKTIPEAVAANVLFTTIKWAGILTFVGLVVGFYLGMTWQKNADALLIDHGKQEADLKVAMNNERYAWVDMLNANIEHIAKAAHSCHMANNPNTPGVVACAYIFNGIKTDAMAWPVFDENKLAMAHQDTPEEQDLARKGTESKFLTPDGGQ